jgi:small subunit ribosomal protein S3Ae
LVSVYHEYGLFFVFFLLCVLSLFILLRFILTMPTIFLFSLPLFFVNYFSVDPFSRKEWYHVRAPAVFPQTKIGRTVVTKTTGTKVAKDSLMGRVFEVSLGDLKEHAEDEAFRKFKLRVEDVNGRHCLTNFWGMSLTTDKLRSLVRKWHTLIEANTTIETTDGYSLRLFAIGFTHERPNQRKRTSYAQSAQIRNIRKKMIDVMQRETAGQDLRELVVKFIPGVIGKEIEKATQGIYPLNNCHIRKVKVLRAPKGDAAKLADLHGGAAAIEDMGKELARAAAAAAAAAAQEPVEAAETTEADAEE